MNGKITGNTVMRGLATGCKPVCGSPVWFAREPPWRHGRTALRYQGVKCVLCEREFGWYRGRIRLSSQEVGTEGVFISIRN